MSKQATPVNCGKTISSGLKLLLLAGAAAAGSLVLAGSATAQQAYYFPQASSAPVSVNYGALSPYGAAPQVVPGVPAGFQPYGYAAPYAAPYSTPARVTSQPKSVFTPGVAPVYVRPGYASPVYGYAPTNPLGAYPAAPANVPFVAPYANPAFAPGFAANRAGLPISTPTASPQSYLNVPGAQPLNLKAPGEAAPAKKKKKKKAPAPMPASTPTATEEGAAAQVAAAEAALESAPAPVALETPAAPAAVEAAAAPEAVTEPVPAPTPPAEPTDVPASVPSPAASVPAAAIAPAAEAPAAETPSVEAPAAETPSAEAPASDAPAEQVASAEAPAETLPDTSGAAVLPAGGTRIVFEGDSDDLPQGASAELDAIADKMLTDETIKVQVLAYSSGTADAESQARRKALARGLEVRKYLIGKGVRSNRIDVRALGTKSEGSPADRVDIVPSAG